MARCATATSVNTTASTSALRTITALRLYLVRPHAPQRHERQPEHEHERAEQPDEGEPVRLGHAELAQVGRHQREHLAHAEALDELGDPVRDEDATPVERRGTRAVGHGPTVPYGTVARIRGRTASFRRCPNPPAPTRATRPPRASWCSARSSPASPTRSPAGDGGPSCWRSPCCCRCLHWSRSCWPTSATSFAARLVDPAVLGALLVVSRAVLLLWRLFAWERWASSRRSASAFDRRRGRDRRRRRRRTAAGAGAPHDGRARRREEVFSPWPRAAPGFPTPPHRRSTRTIRTSRWIRPRPHPRSPSASPSPSPTPASAADQRAADRHGLRRRPEHGAHRHDDRGLARPGRAHGVDGFDPARHGRRAAAGRPGRSGTRSTASSRTCAGTQAKFPGRQGRPVRARRRAREAARPQDRHVGAGEPGRVRLPRRLRRRRQRQRHRRLLRPAATTSTGSTASASPPAATT